MLKRIACDPPQECEAPTPLEVVVPFTTLELTEAALDLADTLVRQLDGCIRVILIHTVPPAFSLDRPPIAREHLESTLHRLMSASRAYGELYLARDSEQTWNRLLRRKRVVVIASPKRFWLTSQERLARMLRRDAYSGEADHDSGLMTISNPGSCRSPSERSDAGSFHDRSMIGISQSFLF